MTQIIMINSAGQDKDTVSSLTSKENFTATWLRATRPSINSYGTN